MRDQPTRAMWNRSPCVVVCDMEKSKIRIAAGALEHTSRWSTRRQMLVSGNPGKAVSCTARHGREPYAANLERNTKSRSYLH